MSANTFAGYIVANAAGLTEETFTGLSEHFVTMFGGDTTAEEYQTVLDGFFEGAEALVDEAVAAPAAKAPGKGKGKGKGKAPAAAVEAGDGSVVLVLNYTVDANGNAKSHAIFGDTESHKVLLNKLNTDWKGYPAVVKYNPRLRFGPGWIVLVPDRVNEVTEMFDANSIVYETKEAADYEAEVHPPKGKGTASKATGKGKAPKGGVAPVAKGKGAAAKGGAVAKGKGGVAPVAGKGKGKTGATAPVAGKGKGGAPKAPPPAVRPTMKLVANEWGNVAEPEHGIVFYKLPVGAGGREVAIAVGVQNFEEMEASGIASVLPLDDENVAICEAKEWRYINDEIMSILETKLPEKYTELAPMMGWVVEEGVEEETAAEDE